MLHVRTSGNPSPRIAEFRRVVGAVDIAVPVTRAHTLLDQIERNVADERMSMAIGLTLALVALLLATAGIYATMAFLVGRRTREIGVRIALGARTTDVRSLVVREGVLLALTGVLCGLALSAWVGHGLRHQLYGIGPLDAVERQRGGRDPRRRGAARQLAAGAPGRAGGSDHRIAGILEGPEGLLSSSLPKLGGPKSPPFARVDAWASEDRRAWPWRSWWLRVSRMAGSSATPTGLQRARRWSAINCGAAIS